MATENSSSQCPMSKYPFTQLNLSLRSGNDSEYCIICNILLVTITTIALFKVSLVSSTLGSINEGKLVKYKLSENLELLDRNSWFCSPQDAHPKKKAIYTWEVAKKGRLLYSGFKRDIMVSLKKLIKMAKKWQKTASPETKGTVLQRTESRIKTGRGASSMANKGHFIVYTADGRRCLIPLSYLKFEIFKELLRMSREEFGLQSDRPIKLSCDAFFREYIVSLMHGGLSKELEIVLTLSLATRGCSAFSSLSVQECLNRDTMIMMT
ncbi:Small auxin-up RNA [Dillenia turbinata]|uniref:Small auxin-up RNA n=1 Tax=Dillenia turbinata TaxID=194707 RepID=A0AAN8ZAG9_9MAGN